MDTKGANNMLMKLLIIFGLLLFIGCGEAQKETETAIEEVEVSGPVDSLVITLDGVEGKTVFEITNEQHEVEYLESAVGMFVHAIDSTEIGSEYGWMYSVNDSMAQVASDKYITNNSDIIKWHYRKF
jgi:hypothetical protein